MNCLSILWIHEGFTERGPVANKNMDQSHRRIVGRPLKVVPTEDGQVRAYTCSSLPLRGPGQLLLYR